MTGRITRNYHDIKSNTWLNKDVIVEIDCQVPNQHYLLVMYDGSYVVVPEDAVEVLADV